MSVYIVTLLYLPFCSSDLDRDTMTLAYIFDLDVLKVYLYTKN